jgi:prevent-host-death family protein
MEAREEPTLIGVRELKNEATRVVREILETQAEYIVTVRGEPAAVIRPFMPEDAERLRLAKVERYLKDLDELAEEIGKAWISPKTARELVEEQRRG